MAHSPSSKVLFIAFALAAGWFALIGGTAIHAYLADGITNWKNYSSEYDSGVGVTVVLCGFVIIAGIILWVVWLLSIMPPAVVGSYIVASGSYVLLMLSCGTLHGPWLRWDDWNSGWMLIAVIGSLPMAITISEIIAVVISGRQERPEQGKNVRQLRQ